MRNLFYIEDTPFGLRAKIGASSNSSVEIYFDSIMRESGGDFITLLDYRVNTCACINLERFNFIDREVLSKLPEEEVFDEDGLFFFYRKCGRCLRSAESEKKEMPVL